MVDIHLRPLMRLGEDNKERKKKGTRKCGSMPNVMAALPNIGSALCLTPQSLADAHY